MSDDKTKEQEELFNAALSIAKGSALNDYLQTLTKLPRAAQGFAVKTDLKMTERGFGIFAAEFLPAGTRVDLDLPTTSFTREQAFEFIEATSSDEQRRWWLNHIYCMDGFMKIEMTELDISMVNHSNDPTIVTKEDGLDYTTRNVHVGEELTEDYRTYDTVAYYDELCKKYGVENFSDEWK